MGAVVSIPAAYPFAPTLARGLVDRYGARGLGRVTLLLPSRRALLVMQEAFVDATDGAPLLLPRLVAVGDIAAETGLLDAEVEFALPPPLDDLRRQLLLFELVRRVDRELPDEQAFRLAESLRQLIDELADEAIPLGRLSELDQTGAAEHWQRVARFLDVLATGWAEIEREAGGLGRSERRRRLLGAVAAQWQVAPPGPVVLAGATGSVPAVADLMTAVAGLPEGLVVLPGIDPAFTPSERAAADPSHPQWGLAKLLDRLDLVPADVAAWPEARGTANAERQRLLSAVTRPASLTPPSFDAAAALVGVERLEAPDVGSEALAIALVLRTVLETEEHALVVTPDRQLARRIAAELGRFGLSVEDSAGQPLDQTPPGVFALLVAHACLDADPVVHWLALLKHPLARAGTDVGRCRRMARQLDLALRKGVEAAPGWASLVEAAGCSEAASVWFARIAVATADLRALAARDAVGLVELIDAHAAALAALAGDAHGDASELWAGSTGAALAEFLDDLRHAVRDGAPVAPAAFAPMLASAMALKPVRRVQRGHPQIEILGRFEARLASADLVVLAGLNEGVWPDIPGPGPWLGRAQRDALGLPPPEEHVGFAAHDLVQLAAAAPRLLLTRSRRDATGGPTLRSRLLDQLDRALSRTAPGVRVATSPALAWARTFDRTPGRPKPWRRPEPRPPVDARPTRLSVTEIERLVHNPYAVYAERVLGLRPLDPPARAADARDRGTLVHAALDAFHRTVGVDLPADALERLLEEGRRVFDAARLGDGVVALWRPRFERLAAWLIATEPARRRDVQRILTEHRVQHMLDLGIMQVELRGRIDRLDLRDGGDAALYDFKTGAPPTNREVEDGRKPQLPLLGALLEQAIGDFEPARVGSMAYLELRGGEPPGREQAIRAAPEALIEQTFAGVRRLLRAYADPSVPYVSVPQPEVAAFPDPYAALSRDREWLDAEALP